MSTRPTPRLLVKICGLTRVHDAEWCTELGADYLGLNYSDSPRAAPLGLGRTLVEREFSVVGVFRGRSDEEIVDVVDRESLSVVQLHDPASRRLQGALRTRRVEVWRALPADEWASQDLSGALRLVLDGPEPGSGKRANWGDFEPRHVPYPYLIAGGLNPDNVAAMVKQLRPTGVDVASGVESAPGIKSPDKVRNFIDNARRASGSEGSR
ncbi:MAG: phosphoribosylanthranilate isomerase [Acidimicrobiaceae bacterium]|nr:phosphoribosylanthranilate isomerase [Acidimicrobiaceae bacterium]